MIVIAILRFLLYIAKHTKHDLWTPAAARLWTCDIGIYWFCSYIF